VIARPQALGFLTIAVALLALAHAGYSAWCESWTFDELHHLRWSERLLQSGETERESDEHFDSKTPIMVPNVLMAAFAKAAGIADPHGRRFASRLPSIAWLASLLAATFCLARRAFGLEAAQIATCGVALDPSIVAHSTVATVDVAYAVATVLTLGALASFAQAPSPRRGITLGLAVGLALTAKFTAVVLLCGLVVALPGLLGKLPPRRSALGLMTAGAVAWSFLCTAYLFREVGLPLGSATWHTAPFRELSARLPAVPVLLPMSFLTGLDTSVAHERVRGWTVVLLGRRFPEGVWYYFAVLWLLKTPVLALGAQILGLYFAFRGRLIRWGTLGCFLALSLVWHLAYFSLFFKAQIGYRFVLMCVPIAWILAGAGLRLFWRPSWTPILLGLVLCFTLGENLEYFGDPLAFSNAAVWPKSSVYRLMADSNLDWGQDQERVAAWVTGGNINPERLDPLHVLPGLNAFSVNNLAGLGDFERHRWLREHAEPVGRFGYTVALFEISPELFERFMDENRRYAPWAAPWCGGDLLARTLEAEESVSFRVSRPTRPDRAWLVCAEASRVADLSLRAIESRIEIAHVEGGDLAGHKEILNNHGAWYRLEPGIHAFVVRELLPSPSSASYEFHGRWEASREEIRLEVGEAAIGADGRLSPLPMSRIEGWSLGPVIAR
jgi:4-amino-4-deoxy-L-arabinose transferase-like glycosyltransferase